MDSAAVTDNLFGGFLSIFDYSKIVFKSNNNVRVKYDEWLVWSVALLLSFGLVMVYSASIAIADSSSMANFQSSYFLVRQLAFIFIGFLAGVVVYKIPIIFWEKSAPYLFLFGLVLLVLVLVPGIGKVVNGSRRWISLVGFNFQPSEFMKLLVVFYAADYTVRKKYLREHLYKAFWPMAVVMGVVGYLLLFEPDMGAFVVIFVIAFTTLWLGGFNAKVFTWLLVVLPILFSALIFSSEYRYKRVTGFMDPFADPLGKGYQLSHSLMAIGRGEWFGVGLGSSIEKMFYLPEAHTDFLVAIVGEELGFVGIFAIIILIGLFVARALSIGRRAAFLEKHFAALTAQGIAVWIGFQSCINIGVNLGLLPTKGLTLPFLSFGGSSTVACCVAVAVLLRIDFENNKSQVKSLLKSKN